MITGEIVSRGLISSSPTGVSIGTRVYKNSENQTHKSEKKR